MHTSVVEESSKAIKSERGLWNQWGPFCLVAALSILVFKCAPLYWPFTLLSFLGYGCISLLRKTGLVISLTALFSLATFTGSSYEEKAWWVLFLAAIAFSWVLIYFQKEQSAQLSMQQESSLTALQSEICALKEQLIDFKSRSHADKSYLEQLQAKQASALQKATESLMEQQRANETLSKALQEKELLCLKLQGQLYSDTALEPKEEEVLRFEQLEHQYKTLKGHFEEKSASLAAARKDLFRVDTSLCVLQKEVEENRFSASEEVSLLTQELVDLEHHCEELEAQIDSLQKLISLLIPFAKTRLV